MDQKTFEILSRCATAAEMAFLAELERDDSYSAQSLYKDVARYVFNKSLDEEQ
jgi:hypothetical protein